MDAVGERAGRQLAERCARDRAPLLEQLEAVKFICKEFWGEVFRKAVDNLRTNHRCGISAPCRAQPAEQQCCCRTKCSGLDFCPAQPLPLRCSCAHMWALT